MTGIGDPMQAALRHLERRARTVHEVRAHLSGKGFEEEAVAEVLSRLSSMGYLDDRAYAARFASWSADERPMGRRRLEQELAHRGVGRDTIEAVLDETFGPDQEAEALRKAVSKASRRATAAGARERRRLASYLLRRGFRPSQVMAAIDALAKKVGDPEGESQK